MLRIFGGLCAPLLACGCATVPADPDAVPARQGGYLTRPDMAWDAGLVEEASIRTQTFVSKEAASGGPSLGHGGCGCN